MTTSSDYAKNKGQIEVNMFSWLKQKQFTSPVAWLLVAMAFFFVSTSSSATRFDEKIVFGVSMVSIPDSDPVRGGPFIDETIRTVEASIGKANLEVRFYAPDELEKAVRAGKVNLFFSSAGLSRRLVLEGKAVVLVASLTTEGRDSNASAGSVLFTRVDNTAINELEDARGKVFAVSQPDAFTGYQIPMGEVAKLAKDPEKFFRSILFLGNDTDKVFDAVREGVADVGAVRTCYLETLGLIGGKTTVFKVLSPKKNDLFRCARSTDLYPGWTISSSSEMDPLIAREISVELLQQKASGTNGMQWGIATNFSKVDELYRILKIGPYEYLRHWTVKRVVCQANCRLSPAGEF